MVGAHGPVRCGGVAQLGPVTQFDRGNRAAGVAQHQAAASRMGQYRDLFQRAGNRVAVAQQMGHQKVAQPANAMVAGIDLGVHHGKTV